MISLGRNRKEICTYPVIQGLEGRESSWDVQNVRNSQCDVQNNLISNPNKSTGNTGRG